MNEAPFNTLHDGTIVELSGSIPGDISLVVECQYLRERFYPKGLHFVVRLHNCRGLVFEPYDENSLKVQDLHDIAERELDILSAEVDRNDIVICCGSGDLRVRCQTVSVWLDNNHRITQAQLERAAQTYWDEWESNKKKRS